LTCSCLSFLLLLLLLLLPRASMVAAAASGYEARRRRAVVEAESALMGECTFQPRINSNHKTRQERVAELLARH
jgi:hypothetical protein